MAAKKRRKSRLSGLGGSPAHHAKEAIAAGHKAVAEYKHAAKGAAAGKCAFALDAMNRGSVASGIAAAHDRESGARLSVSATGSIVDASAAAERAFKKECMQGGLSGMRRRRR